MTFRRRGSATRAHAALMLALLGCQWLQLGCGFVDSDSHSEDLGDPIPGTVRPYSENDGSEQFHVTSEPYLSPDGRQLLVFDHSGAFPDVEGEFSIWILDVTERRACRSGT